MKITCCQVSYKFTAMIRKRISSGSPYEKPIGFSRAVLTGNRILIKFYGHLLTKY